MSEVTVVDVPPAILAAVIRRVRWQDLSTRIPQILGEVWKVVRASGVGFRHNVCIYRSPAEDDVELVAGVQIDNEIAPSGDVVAMPAPSGKAARVLHVGPYANLGAAHDAVATYCETHRHRDGGVHWEVYGDWNDDPALLETEVFRSLK